MKSEASEKGLFPPKDVEDMTSDEFHQWRNSLDPDAMGFNGEEGVSVDRG